MTYKLLNREIPDDEFGEDFTNNVVLKSITEYFYAAKLNTSREFQDGKHREICIPDVTDEDRGVSIIICFDEQKSEYQVLFMDLIFG
jgi:hypothetical protein